jgi:tricorn protease-like protein
LIKKSLKTTSLKKEESAEVTPIVYSPNQEFVRLSLPDPYYGFNHIKIFDLERREVQSMKEDTQHIDIPVRAQRRKYILRLMNNDTVKNFLFIH